MKNSLKRFKLARHRKGHHIFAFKDADKAPAIRRAKFEVERVRFEYLNDYGYLNHDIGAKNNSHIIRCTIADMKRMDELPLTRGMFMFQRTEEGLFAYTLPENRVYAENIEYHKKCMNKWEQIAVCLGEKKVRDDYWNEVNHYLVWKLDLDKPECKEISDFLEAYEKEKFILGEKFYVNGKEIPTGWLHERVRYSIEVSDGEPYLVVTGTPEKHLFDVLIHRSFSREGTASTVGYDYLFEPNHILHSYLNNGNVQQIKDHIFSMLNKSSLKSHRKEISPDGIVMNWR